MDIATTHEPTPSSPGAAGSTSRSGPDGLAAEVRESVLLLLLSIAVTAGLAGAASALLSLLA